MAGRIKAAIDRGIPWLLFGSVLIPAGLSAGVGILVLVFRRQGGDIALGVLAIALGVAVLTGTIISLALLQRQNRMVRAQADLVAHIGHELRTPLASVLMGIETIRQDRCTSDAEKRAFLDMIDHEANRLATLVEQAIGYQVAAGRRKRHDDDRPADEVTISAPAGSIVREALATWMTRPDTAGLLSFEDNCLESDMLSVDGVAFEGALSNLVGNAMSHGGATAEKPVIVTVETAGVDPAIGSDGRRKGATRKDRDARKGRDGWIVVQVADHGPGIRKADIRRVFGRFQRGRGTTGNDIPGLGLGLAIVREFAAAAGGRVGISETPGGGATFTMTLPRVAGCCAHEDLGREPADE